MSYLRIKFAGKFFTSGVFVILLIGAGFFQEAFSQAAKTEPAREMMSLTIITVKPDMVPDFENLIKTEYNPAISRSGVKNSEVWQTASFGGAWEYTFVQKIEKFAQMDGPSPLVRALGADGAKAFFAKASKMVTKVRGVAIQTRPDMSFMGKMSGMPNLAVIAHVQVAQGRSAEFESFIKNSWLPAVKKSGVGGYWVSQVMFGGNVNEYISVTLQENFAELDKGPPVARVLGQAGLVNLMRRLPNGVVTNLERYLVRFNPDLSIVPADMK